MNWFVVMNGLMYFGAGAVSTWKGKYLWALIWVCYGASALALAWIEYGTERP